MIKAKNTIYLTTAAILTSHEKYYIYRPEILPGNRSDVSDESPKKDECLRFSVITIKSKTLNNTQGIEIQRTT